MCNLFSVNAIKKIADENLPYHVAHKKIKHYKEGKEIVPQEPNAYKFEQFIFDSFPLFENITLLRGKREEDFAPIKNKEGKDSPKTAIDLYNNYMKRKNWQRKSVSRKCTESKLDSKLNFNTQMHKKRIIAIVQYIFKYINKNFRYSG